MWRHLIAAIAVCILAAPGCWAQCSQIGIPTLARIQGMILDSDEKPLSGVIVNIHAVNPDGTAGSLLSSVTSGKDGKFSTKGKEGSTYELRVQRGEQRFDGVRMKVGSPVIRRTSGLQTLILALDEGKCPAVSLAP
jgi:hypothetical protein